MADPTFSTGGSCQTNAASRVPAGAQQIVLSNPSKLHLAASLYRRIDKPNFKYVDAVGAERLSDFPYFYQVYIPPGGSGSVGCTKIFIAGGEAAQTFVLQATDYFFQSPTDLSENAKPYVGFVGGDATGWHSISFHPTKTIHVTIGTMTFDLAPQAVSTSSIDVSENAADKPVDGHSPPYPAVTDAHF